MQEKKYPIIEEEDGYGCMKAAEPVAALSTEQTFTYSNEKKLFDYPKDYDPGIGPYSMKEMNLRIDKAERDRDNPDKWIRVDNFWSAMQKEHLWLQ